MCVKNESWMKNRYIMAVRCTENAFMAFKAQKSFDPDVIYEGSGRFVIVWNWLDHESFIADRKQREDMYSVMDSLEPLYQDDPFQAWHSDRVMYSMIVYGNGAVIEKRANICQHGTIPMPRLKVSLIVPEGEVDDVAYLKDECDTVIYIKKHANTRMQYSLRSVYSRSSGEKASYDVVVRGRLSQEEIDRIEESLNCDGFVPSMVSLPSCGIQRFTFDMDSISETNDPPTVNISAKKLVRKFAEAYIKGWVEDLPFV